MRSQLPASPPRSATSSICCARHVPAEGLAALAKEYQARGVAVVAISSNSTQTHPQDGPDKMAEDAAKWGACARGPNHCHAVLTSVHHGKETASRHQARAVCERHARRVHVPFPVRRVPGRGQGGVVCADCVRPGSRVQQPSHHDERPCCVFRRPTLRPARPSSTVSAGGRTCCIAHACTLSPPPRRTHCAPACCSPRSAGQGAQAGLPRPV